MKPMPKRHLLLSKKLSTQQVNIAFSSEICNAKRKVAFFAVLILLMRNIIYLKHCFRRLSK